MTRRNDLEALAARVEELMGPCRETEGMIALAFGWTREKMARDRYPYWRKPGETRQYMRSDSGPPTFTASLDAAMTLVPEGCGVRLLITWDGIASALAGDNASTAHTPAHALTAAALRARASKEQDA